MKCLILNYEDLVGRRFNGYDLIFDMPKYGIDVKQMVLFKHSKNKNVISLLDSFFLKIKFGFEYSLDLLFSQQLKNIKNRKSIIKNINYKEADILHYQIIHNSMMNFNDMVYLTNDKPTIWSIHDLWAITGHCTHPIECNKWLSGCHDCPHLERVIPIKKDNSSKLYSLKENAIKNMNCEIVVSSEWMRDKLSQSSFFEGKQIHVIPFGIDNNLFAPRDKNILKEKYGINNKYVLMFRESDNYYKNMNLIVNGLKMINIEDVAIITVDQKGLLSSLKGKFDIYEFGVITDDNVLVDLYNISDLFLMPSIAESFGMMAIEAMSCGTPVLSCFGTALETVIKIDDEHIFCNNNDTNSFKNNIEYFLNNKNILDKISKKCREQSLEYYSKDKYLTSLSKLYNEVYSKCAKKL